MCVSQFELKAREILGRFKWGNFGNFALTIAHPQVHTSIYIYIYIYKSGALARFVLKYAT